MTKNELRLAAARAEKKITQDIPEVLLDLLQTIDDNDRKIGVIIDALTLAYDRGYQAGVETIPVVDTDDAVLIL